MPPLTQAAVPEMKAVLFADLLGFAALTENHPLELDRIQRSDRPLGNPQEWQSANPPWNIDTIETMLASLRVNALTHAFTGFHQSLKLNIQFAQMRHPVTAITFSDSAFISTTYLFEAV